MKKCIGCNKELKFASEIHLSTSGDVCCKDCVKNINELDKPCSNNSDIEYLSKNELVDLVYNLSVWGDKYDLDDVNEIVENYRYNNPRG